MSFMNNYINYVNSYNFINHMATSMAALLPMTIEESSMFLNHFRENYYRDATLFSHMTYIRTLYAHYQRNCDFPSKNEFYLSFRRECLCPYSYHVTEEVYLQGCDFFMKTTGDIIKLSCEDFYNFSEFVMIEHRPPSTLQEYIGYVRRIIIAQNNPEALFGDNDIVVRPVENEKIEQLRQSVCITENESCGICQETIHSQQAVKLDCGHYFHFKEEECCGTVLKWFETNNKCPICRKEI